MKFDTRTSEPLGKTAQYARNRAAVPEFTALPYCAPEYFAKSSENCLVSCPSLSVPFLITWSTKSLSILLIRTLEIGILYGAMDRPPSIASLSVCPVNSDRFSTLPPIRSVSPLLSRSQRQRKNQLDMD